jgi:hypothetical protein
MLCFAIRAFRRQVLENCQRVLNAKLSGLREATGTDLQQDSIWRSSFPDKAAQDNWTAEVCLLTVGVTLRDRCDMWFGLVWHRNDANEGIMVRVTAALTFKSEPSRAVLDKLHRLGANETGWFWWIKHEVSFSEPVFPRGGSDISSKTRSFD